ncbi:hypothetical protein O181_043966 [Austropuccinia psidii MF-1]|uniref:Uncharacterized protein n=1 Tax=Austropuccinia psidii MF-1 TaxID=1389203 RepID=A0A9Q3HGG7_9BASI|nr:hypothetical protein [Austropuccinia psidii MF-1]
MSAQGRVPVLKEAFEKLIDPAMDPSMREKWAKTFAKIMDAQKDDLMERALEVEMQVQLLDLEVYAKRISATTSKSWDGLIAFTNLRERLADRLEHKVQILEREPWLDYRLDNVLLFARDRMKDIVEDPAVVFEENILLKEHYGKLTSTDSTDDEFKTIWHQVAELGKSTNTETLTRQKVVAVCLLCYVFEVATQDGPEGPQAIRAVKEMKAIVNNDNFQNDFIKPLWSRLSFELKDCQARWLQRKSSEGSSASLGDPHLH